MNYLRNTLTDIRKFNEGGGLYLRYLGQELGTIINRGYKYSALSEAQSNFFEAQKNRIKKLIDSIDENWKRYLDNTNKINNNSTELKNIIKKIKAIKKDDIGLLYHMYPYWKNSKCLSVNDFPNFSITDNELMAALSSTDDFYNKYLRKYISGSDNISQGCIQYIRGESQKNQMNFSEIQIHLDKVFDYIESFKNTISAIESQYNKIHSSFNIFENSILSKAQVTREGTLYIFSESKLFNELDVEDYKALRESSRILCEAKDLDDPRTRDKQDFIVSDTITNKDAKEFTDKFITYITEYYKILSVKMSLSEEIYLTYEDLLKKIEERI